MSEAVVDVTWYSAVDLGLRGQGWRVPDLRSPFERLPARAEALVSDQIWDRAIKPAGIYVDVVSNARQLSVRYRLSAEIVAAYADSSALLTGGIDCYGLCPERGWRWVGQFTPSGSNGLEWQGAINLKPLDGEMRTYRFYTGINTPMVDLAIGVEAEAVLTAAPAEDASRLIVAYGTSIVHGWTVGRPGMAHPQIMARHLQRPIISLGFAGVARMEFAIADLLGELNPAVYTIDCLPNMSVEQIHQRFRPFLDRLRQLRPNTPILYVGDRMFGDHSFCPQRGQEWRAKNQALEQEFIQAEHDGIQLIGLLHGQDFFGADSDGTMDASHPNDLGAQRMAHIVATALTQRGW